MSERARLLLDVGNTKLKYAWYELGQSLDSITSNSIELAGLNKLLSNKPIVYLCSVKASDITEELLHVLTSHNIDYIQAHTQAKQFGIVNSYSTVANMGSDRWLAMLGAEAMTQKDVIVIDAGTAITCDFVVGKQHLGGWIAPGLSILRQAVVRNTQRVFDVEGLVSELSPGQDTPFCVANGALAQLSGMVLQAIEVMRPHSANFDLVLSGGDRKALLAALPHKNTRTIIEHPNLVLAGLARIYAEEQRESQ